MNKNEPVFSIQDSFGRVIVKKAYKFRVTKSTISDKNLGEIRDILES